MTTDPAFTVYTAIAELLIDLADNVQDLDAGLVENKPVIMRLGAERPTLWQQLKALAEAKRAALRKAGHLTPVSGARVNRPPLSADPFKAYHQLTEGL